MEKLTSIPKKVKFITITLLSLFKFRFKSFKRFLIYAFYYSNFINIREYNSINDISNEKLVSILDIIFKYKISKKELYKITNCSKNTFNKKLSKYLTEEKLIGRRKFTLIETYGILNEWQGDGKWVSMESIKKEKLAEIFSNGDYKNISKEIGLLFGKEFYKNNDKFSPKEIKQVLMHIDELESEKGKMILEEIDGKISLWIFAILLGFQIWDRRKQHTT